MTLSCSCDYDWGFDAGDWYYDWNPDPDFEPLSTSRRKRCSSCGELINIGDLHISHPRCRYPYNDIEARINGFDDIEDALMNEAPIRIADHYLCEKCGEIYLNLQSVGFECVSPGENMTELLKEYQQEYKPQKLFI